MAKKSEKKEIPASMADVAKALEAYAYKHGQDSIKTWNDWLEWLCGVFDWNNMKFGEEGGHPLVERFEWAQKDNPEFFAAMQSWLEYAFREMTTKGPTDAFGSIYENCFQSKGKADQNGQFFTPMHVCDLMAKVLGPQMPGEDGIIKYNDCAVGSGRMLVAAWGAADKYAKNYFEAGDLDATSVRMTALNMMVNGMVGTVHCQNALSHEWRFGYVVNACKVPFANDFAAIEFVGDEKEMAWKRERLLELMKDWNVGKYRPQEDGGEEGVGQEKTTSGQQQGDGGEQEAPVEAAGAREEPKTGEEAEEDENAPEAPPSDGGAVMQEELF